MLHKKLPYIIYFALATNYFNVFMSTTVLLGLTSFEKNWGQWILGGGSKFSNLLGPWASGSRSLMLRAGNAWYNEHVCIMNCNTRYNQITDMFTL